MPDAAPLGGRGEPTDAATAAADASTFDAGTSMGRAVIDCREQPLFSGDPELAQAFEGDNGAFADACTDDGNLRKYACEMVPDPGCTPVFPNPPPCPYIATGTVIEETIDCVGQCRAGACESGCPRPGDRLELLGVDADSVLLSSPTPDRRLRCKLTFEQPNDGFDCTTLSVGQQGFISSLGLQGSYCTGGPFGNIGACFQTDCNAVGQNCTYACSVEPG